MAGYADVIFGGGAIYTADAGGRRLVPATAPDGQPATAVAVAGGTVVARRRGRRRRDPGRGPEDRVR